MKEIFVAIIMIFDVQTGQPLDAGIAAFDNRAACEAMVTRIAAKAAGDMLVVVDAQCVATPLVTVGS